MPNLPASLSEPDADALATESAREDRRRQVLRLRVLRMNDAQIGRASGVSERTVGEDLAAIHARWRDPYGANLKFDLAAFIGESLAVYADVEATALREAERANVSSRDKTAFLHTAKLAREQQVALVRVTGVRERASSTRLTSGLLTGAQIRAAIEAAEPDLDDPALALPDPD